MLPFGYAIRNLFRDPTRLLQTVLGSTMVTFMVMLAASINAGMTSVLDVSGSPNTVLLLGAGSEESTMRSEISERSAGIAEASLSGIAAVAGERAVSPEIHQMTLIGIKQDELHKTFMRGITPRSLLVHRQVVLTEGTFPKPGQLMVGRLAWLKLGLPKEELRPGKTVFVEKTKFIVSGIFAAPGSVMESEVWMDINDMRSLSLRENLSCVALRLDDGDYEDVSLFTAQRLDLELSALRASDYYGRLSDFYAPVRTMTWITAFLIATGALLGGLNTLYAAFAPRIREIATLQAVGYSRGAIMFSFVQESTLATMCGAILAALIAATVLDGIAVSFSIGTFALRVTPTVALIGLCTGLCLGFVGAVPPGLRCLIPPLPEALRAPV